jgi:isoamylase
VDFTIPSDEYGASWDEVIDTAGKYADSDAIPADTTISVEAKSMVVLRAHTEVEDADHSVAASLAILANEVTAKTGTP